MGGSSYDRDVGSASSSSSFSDDSAYSRRESRSSFASGGTSSYEAKEAFGSRRMDSRLNPDRRTIMSSRTSPIVLCMDVTGSNIEFVHVVWDKMPRLYGQIEKQKFLTDFEICFAAVGDATCDEAPLQVADFKRGKELDDELAKIWLESGGGSYLTESYELAAYYFAHNCEMPKALSPFFFMIADEYPYSEVNPREVSKTLGDNLTQPIPSAKVFDDLFATFKDNVYVLLNPYHGEEGRTTDTVNQKWREILGKHSQNIIPLYEEKSLIDVILGIIAVRTKVANLDQFKKQLVADEQTEFRVANVEKSLRASKALMAVDSGSKLPATSGTKRSSGSHRI